MKKLPKTSKYSSGQALLLVLLSMAVVLTIVLSILSRSVTDVAITTRDEDALRAFSAAEAGIERALIIGEDIDDSLGEAEFSADVTEFAEGLKEFVYPIKLLSGEAATIWFVGHDANGNLSCSAEKPCFTGDTVKICWGEPGTGSGDSATPAIEVSVFYAESPGDYSTIKIARATYDSNGTRRLSNNFDSQDSGDCTVAGSGFEFKKTINLGGLGIPAGVLTAENGLQFARVRIFYNTLISHPFGVDVSAGDSLLPSQGLEIKSSGLSGEANRKISVFRAFGEPPPIFDAAIFSAGGGITK